MDDEEYKIIKEKLKVDRYAVKVEGETRNLICTMIDDSPVRKDGEQKGGLKDFYIVYIMMKTIFRILLKAYEGDMKKFDKVIKLAIEDILYKVEKS